MNTSLADRIRNNGTGQFRTGPPAEAQPSPRPQPVKGVSATPAQVRYLGVLLAERSGGEAAEIARKLGDGKLTKRDASDAITALKALPKRQSDQQAPVEAPSGPLPVWPGRYTLETSSGHRTFQVRLQGEDESFAPGELILEHLTGQDNTSDYTSFAFVKRDGRLVVWKRHRDNTELVADAEAFLADPEAALVAKHCARCNEVLTVPESIDLGYGPVCITKIGK